MKYSDLVLAFPLASQHSKFTNQESAVPVLCTKQTPTSKKLTPTWNQKSLNINLSVAFAKWTAQSKHRSSVARWKSLCQSTVIRVLQRVHRSFDTMILGKAQQLPIREKLDTSFAMPVFSKAAGPGAVAASVGGGRSRNGCPLMSFRMWHRVWGSRWTTLAPLAPLYLFNTPW